MHALQKHFQAALVATPDGLYSAHLRHAVVHWVWPMIGVAVALEIGCFLLIQRRAYPWHEMLSSAAVYVMRFPAQLLRPVIVAPIAYLSWSHRLVTIPLNAAWGLPLLFLGEEFAYYWMHRASHEIRWLWASHVVHHTPEHLHFASAFRLGMTELLSGTWLFYLPLYVLGLNPLAVSTMLGINLLYQFWLHTDLVGRLGPLEWILNTPSHHRVHHASNSQYLDRNYGGILIIFDRLFGTFAQEKPGTVIKYGLTHPIGSLNPVKIVFHEWALMARDVARARTWREKLAQAFGRPGANFASLPGTAQAA
jgi:sterol desaturase/sphingolipid hydroxylase (fatty acid hydroxylase superfamily)